MHDEFFWFASFAFRSLNPGLTLNRAWHLRYIADILTQLESGQQRSVIINIPPRNLKSTLISVIWPAWLLGRDPSKRIIVASYSQKLSNKLSIDSRFITIQPWFKEVFPDFAIAQDQNEKHKFMTNKHGFRMAVSTGGMLTGEGGDVLILDDPHNPKEIFSDKLRNKTINWFEQVFLSRLNNQKKGKILLVMQRLHFRDLAGHLIEKGGYELINFPIIFNQEEKFMFNGLSKTIAKGDLLDAHRFDHSTIERLKEHLGEVAFSAQYLGMPVAMSGNFIKKEQIKVSNNIPTHPEQIIQSWDSASCNTITSDYSVCSTWYIIDDIFYLIDIFREKTSFLQLKQAAKNCYQKHRPDLVLIEGKSSGLALFDELQGEGLPVNKINPKEDKVSRLMQVVSYFENHKVVLCHGDYNFIELQNELLQFPQGAHDDQVDSISQFLLWYKNRAYGSVRYT